MTQEHNKSPSSTPDPEVSDPHPGSVSDGTRVDADEAGAVQKIHKDAEGQFVGAQHGGDNDGVISAKPQVITGSQDATTHKWPPGTKKPPKDWDLNYDESSSTNNR